MEKRSLHIRNARDDECETIRDVTLAAYEEYAAIMPTPLWGEYRKQILATLDEEGQLSALLPSAMARSLAACCCIHLWRRPMPRL